MADYPAVVSPGHLPARIADDPSERGALIISDTVARRIAAKAARDTAGVQPRNAVLTKLIGRALPKVTVMISANRVRAAVDVAVPWPQPLTEVTAAVRDNVASALSAMAGLHVDGVDVTVSSILSHTDSAPARILQ